MPRLRDDSASDIFIEHSGLTLGFDIADGEGGVKSFLPFWVPENSQQIQQGPFSYDDRPKAVSQPVTFESFGGGCGVLNAVPGTTVSKTYSYTRGIDPSWERLVLSPQEQAFNEGEMDAAPVKFYRAPSGGWYALSATKVWKLTSGGWALKYTTDGGDLTDIIEYANPTDTYIFVARGDASAFIYTVDDFANTTAVTGEEATFFVIRGSTTVIPVLFAITVTGHLRSSVNPILTGNWSEADQIGSMSETVTAMTVADNLIYIFKEEGIYTFNGSAVGTQVDVSLLKRPGNGKGTLTWINGFMYGQYGGRSLEFDPYNNTTTRLFAPAHPELNGDITAQTADLQFLYVFIRNAEGNTYLIKLDIAEGGPPHTIAYLGDLTVNAAMVIAPNADSPSTTNPILAFGVEGTSHYFILQRQGYRPWEDANYRFTPEGGDLYGSWVDAGAETFPKWLNGARVVSLNTSAGKAGTIAYQLDGDGVTAPVTVLVANTPGIQDSIVDTEVSFGTIREVIHLDTVAATTTPQLLGTVFDTTPNPPHHRGWEMVLDLANGNAIAYEGSPRKVALATALNHLQSAVGEYVTFTDFFGNEFLVKVTDVRPLGFKRAPQQGSGRSSIVTDVRVTMLEIHQNLSVDNPGVWGDEDGVGGTPWDDAYQWLPAE